MPKTVTPPGLAFQRYFTTPEQDPADLFTWTRRHVCIKDDDIVVYEADVEAPDFWSDLAVTVAAKTWFRRIDGKMEDSVKAMFCREADAIAAASKYPDVGTDYFGGDEEKRRAFRDEIFYIQASQHAMFNTPVHVNVGVAAAKHESEEGKRQIWARSIMSTPRTAEHVRNFGVYGDFAPNVGPQASACFIQGVEDTMESLCALQTSETQLFRRGSGTGSNLSSLRPAGTELTGGGTASGPVSFMRAMDGWASVTKSGGSSRRAALMRILDVYHPDVSDFISTKLTAQKMIRDLAAQGWDAGFNAKATTWIPFQNANNSVRVDDAFMTAATTNGVISPHWPTQWADTSREALSAQMKSFPARPYTGPTQLNISVGASKLLDDIAAAAWDCGDPGIQYDTAINKWHTVPQSGRIYGSNPCVEYMHLQDTACNLASLRLTKFLRTDGTFGVDAFSHAARTMFIAQEVLVGAASYPTERIARNSHDFRPLGLGYCDLGAMLMRLGLPYDSDDGRNLCAAVTSLLGGVAYRTSTEMARDCGGAFPSFAVNRDSMLEVLRMHHQAAKGLPIGEIAHVAELKWLAAVEIGSVGGFRNAQATVLAPTGSIGFAMDCDTTGIEPDTALKKRKKLAGGGVVEYVNQSVEPALRRLGYDEAKTKNIVAYIAKTGELPIAYEGHPCDGDRWLAPYHAPVFATAFGQLGNEISVDGHLKMMAAAQPFLSGGISKTVNVPSTYTVADVREVFVKAWKLGLKAVAVYRDGSKDQPLEAAKATESPQGGVVKPQLFGDVKDEKEHVVSTTTHTRPARRRLPADAPAHRHKFTIAGTDGYIHLGFFEDGAVGEIFVRMEPKAKSQIAVDLATQAASIAIQHGAHLGSLLDKWEGTEFAPSGFTGEGAEGVAYATSPLDYLAKWLRRFIETRSQDAAQGASDVATVPSTAATAKQPPSAVQGPCTQCPRCSAALRRDGACLSCPACGYGQGGCGG